MKTIKIASGIYKTVIGDVTLEILRQPEGGWSVYDTESDQTLEYFMTKKEAVEWIKSEQGGNFNVCG